MPRRRAGAKCLSLHERRLKVAGAITPQRRFQKQRAGRRQISHVHALAPAKPKSLIAFSFRISGRTSGLMSSFSKSLSQRSGRITGQSEPNSTLWRNNVLAYLTRIGGKYFGDQPERSI